MSTKSAWFEKYKVAVLETDWTKGWVLIQDAESAIRERQRTLIVERVGSVAEKDEMANALRGIRALREDAMQRSGPRN